MFWLMVCMATLFPCLLFVLFLLELIEAEGVSPFLTSKHSVLCSQPQHRRGF